MIQVLKLYFNYPKRDDVLKDVNLKVEEGDFVGIVGPSGSGKSTLSLTFNGIIPKSISGNLKGDVVVCGLNTKEHEIYELAPKVGIVLQNPEAQLFGMTVEEELAFGPENLGIDVLEIERRIQKALEIVKIHDRERFPFSLSGGEKQRVAIASMLTMLPKVLVLDEPTSQLDPLGKSEVFSLLKNLKKITIVLIEYETEFLATYAKKILVLESGRILRSGTPQEIFSQVKFCEKIGIKVPDVAKFTYRLSELGILDGVCVEFQEALEKCKFLRRRKVLEDEKFKLLSLRKPQVKIEDLSFKYPESEDFALRNVNLEIGRGEALAIRG
ncbi:MAG: ATP-binding cassette domain-containing protein, partial [Candidatus Methanofastidiosia archaeon]